MSFKSNFGLQSEITITQGLQYIRVFSVLVSILVIISVMCIFCIYLVPEATISAYTNSYFLYLLYRRQNLKLIR